MSLIWDLLNGRGAVDCRHPTRGMESAHSRRVIDRRRNTRSKLAVPLFVYGYTAADEPFHEETKAYQVSAGGGLLTINAPVRRGQKLLLRNTITQREQECYVARVTTKQPMRVEVGIAFRRPDADFWKIRA